MIKNLLFLISLDLGFMQVKTYTPNKYFKFLSLIGEPSAFELEQYDKDNSLINNLIITKYSKDEKGEEVGRTYYVGTKALDTDNSTVCTRTDKTNGEQDEIELYAALGYLSEYNKEIKDSEVMIVTGLPVNDFKLAKTLESNLKGKKEFGFKNGKERLEVNIKRVVVIPQSAGAYFSFVLNDNGEILKEQANVVKGTTLVIDVGYKTTDIIVMKNGQYVSKQSSTSEFGMKDIHRELIRKIKKDYDVKYDFSEMDTICREKKISVMSKELDIEYLIQQCEKPVVRSILDHINLYIPDIKKIDKILCCGGTMNRIFPYFNQEFLSMGHSKDTVTLLTDPEYSNAKGYYRYGMMMNGKNRSKA